MSVEPFPVPTFQQGVAALLGRVECRPIIAESDKEDVYRLRYAAYKREGALPPKAPTRFCDRFDDEANTMTFGLYADQRLSSALRIHVVDKTTPEHPGLHVYPDHLVPCIERGETLIDPTRFVIDAEASRRHPKLPYATVRIAWMASEWFAADQLLATVRTEHQAFYHRLFGHRVVCPARPYPTLTKPLSLMALPFGMERARVLSRYGFFASTMAERQALFGAWAKKPRARSEEADALVA